MIIKFPEQEYGLKKMIESMAKELKRSHISQHDKEQKGKTYERLKEHIPILEDEIEKIIDSLKTDITSCDVRHILEHFGFMYNLSSVDSIDQDLEEPRSFKLDYLLSLITSISTLNDQECSDDILEKITASLAELEMKCIVYLMLTSDYKGEPNQTKFIQSMHHMIVRGDSFSEHKVQLCKELFSKFDSILLGEYGLTANKLIDSLVNIANNPLTILETKKLYFDEIKTAHRIFIENLSHLNGEELAQAFDTYRESASVSETSEKLQKIYDKTGISFNDSLFEIKNTGLPENVLQLLSIELGDNTSFKQGKIEYFPTNNSLIYDNPFIRIDDKYYCFNLASIYNCLHKLIENILLTIIPPQKQQKNYYKLKGEYLESKSLKLFEEIMPDCRVYENLKYGIDDEVDGIIIYDNNLFIIESKSNKFTLEAQQGNVDRIKRNTKDIVEKAYQQAIRAKQYILSNKLADFRDKNKRIVLTIDNTNINNIYLINTTLEPLNHLSSDLSSLKEFGFIQNDEWIWSVYLNDLRIISEIIDSPSEFLLYLDRRIKYNDFPQIKMAEELDIFGYFLKEGLYFEDINFPSENFMLSIDSSYSKNIDLYYYWKEGTLKKEQVKPAFYDECKDNIKFLVKEIENIKTSGFTELTKFLLGLNCDTQSFIKKQISLIRKSQRTDFHTYIEEENIGVMFIAKRLYDYDKLKKQCQLYAYERNINNWFLVIIDDNSIGFEGFSYSNSHSEYLAEEVKRLQQLRLEQHSQINKKIGRNETCPCGTGKKYKKCCLNK